MRHDRETMHSKGDIVSDALQKGLAEGAMALLGVSPLGEERSSFAATARLLVEMEKKGDPNAFAHRARQAIADQGWQELIAILREFEAYLSSNPGALDGDFGDIDGI